MRASADVPDLATRKQVGGWVLRGHYAVAYKGTLGGFKDGMPTLVTGELTWHGVTKPVTLSRVIQVHDASRICTPSPPVGDSDRLWAQAVNRSPPVAMTPDNPP